MKSKTLFMAMLMLCSMSANAQKEMKAPKGGKAISDNLIGIFFEDINSAADGGLYAELVQNGSFEYNPNERDEWHSLTSWHIQRPGHSLGYVETRQESAIHPNNPNYLRINIERVGNYEDSKEFTGVGLLNDGYDGIPLKAGKKYQFSIFLRNQKNPSKRLRVLLQSTDKKPKILAETTLDITATEWTEYKATLTPREDCADARLLFLFLGTGSVDIDMVSLMPEDTYNGHGLRKDLVQTLADLHPKFMRFPGGCVVHGGSNGFWNTYHWKATIGPKQQRRGQKNCWGYHQSMGLGYYEYFQLCEDIHMEPLPILPCGVTCQGAGGNWPKGQDACAMEEMDEWVNDAIDLIEWANGSATSKWGRLRAEAGHPEPFNLHYLGLGNEEYITPAFSERFRYIYNKVHQAHPEIIIIGTVGPGSHKGNYDYDNGWKLAEELSIPVTDEHYYEQWTYFLDNQQNYDAYPRERTTKVYLGEYAARDHSLNDALCEALYLLGVEKNADVVTMTSYAPLFAKKNHQQWHPDLIYFDNHKVQPSCSYYVQQMFGLSSGNYYYGDCITFDKSDKYQNQSVILNTKTRQLFVKYCNASDENREATVDLGRFPIKEKATQMVLMGDPKQKNDHEVSPVKPVTNTIKAQRKTTLAVPAHSFTLITYQL